MGKPGNTGIKRVINATGYSFNGLVAAFKHEAAFRQESALFIILAPIAIIFGKTWLETLLLLSTLFLVLIVELINSAIEAVVDRVGLEQHELSGRAKDLGSAAVLVSLILAVTVWAGILLFQYL